MSERLETGTEGFRQYEQTSAPPPEGNTPAATSSDRPNNVTPPIRADRILDELPDGVVVIDANNAISWSNSQFKRLADKEEVVGLGFYTALGDSEILGPDYCPFHTALATSQNCMTKLRVGEKTYLQLLVSPVRDPGGQPKNLIVVVRDITSEVLQQQKLEAIHEAGVKLTDLTPEEVFEMSVEDRIDLLKSNILHYTQSVLNYNVIEIRLLEQQTGKLTSLLYEGIDQTAAERNLEAKPLNNGVTGFVAASGESYLCEDTSEDPLYLPSFEGARSSMTVPLILHDEVIGTFNVESPEPRAFNENDLMFLELFGRDVAIALNTLELMAAESAHTTQKSIEAIHRAVALPIDQILRETVHVLEDYIGHHPEVEDRLRSILRNARDIKELIQEVGHKLAPMDAVASSSKSENRQKFFNRRILVVDAEDNVLDDAHGILERYGCIVETARAGGEAILMVRTAGRADAYDIIICDVRLSDMSGHQLLVHLKELMDRVPLILMQGFGYDPGHSIVKARQAGLHPKAVLYKPFRVDQLLDVVNTILDDSRES